MTTLVRSNPNVAAWSASTTVPAKHVSVPKAAARAIEMTRPLPAPPAHV